MLIGTTKGFEVGFMIHTCLVTRSVSKYKGGSAGSRSNLASNNTS
jgi:hypothetical protein